MEYFEGLENCVRESLAGTGENDFVALLNSVFTPVGTAEEIATIASVLSKLVSRGFLRVARPRKPGQERLTALSEPESIAVLHHLNALVTWSAADGIWEWNPDIPSTILVVLTESGMQWVRRLDRKPE